MDYYKILNFNREPFSNSPDPEFFFQSRQHQTCLQKIEISLRLRRGLNVVVGDVGTGKTTLCRQLIRRFSSDDEAETHLILDPLFTKASEFLLALTRIFRIYDDAIGDDDFKAKEKIKQYLFHKGVDENKTVVLIIDEGQKIPVPCLEILRELLNYETNEYKLLQIVIFAQTEFEQTMKQLPNFTDRISLFHALKPLDFHDTRAMIRFRIAQSAAEADSAPVFSFPAFWAVYRATKGYPRKIVNLCHQVMLALIIQNKSSAGWMLVRSSADRTFLKDKKRIWGKPAIAVVCTAFVMAVAFAIYHPRSVENESDAGMIVPANKSTHGVPGYSAASETSLLSDISQKPLYDRDTMPPSDTAVAPPEPPPENTNAGITENDVQMVAVKSENSKSEGALDKGTTGIEFKSPPILGSVTIHKRESMSRLAKKIYGSCDPKYMESVILANPHIANPDDLEIGDTLYFPAIPALVQSVPENTWWIRIADADTLEKAVDICRTYPESASMLKLIPHWDSRAGLKFEVVHKKYFLDKISALNYLQSSPLKGEVVSLWENDTIFFNDPINESDKTGKGGNKL